MLRHALRDRVVVFDDQDLRHAILSLVSDTDYEALRTAFTASVSHELRTPLARLQALLDTAELPGADLQQLLGQARDEVAEMTELVDDVLFLSELEQGREVVALGETEAAPVLRDIVAELSERAELAGLKLELRIEDETIEVPLRRRMLRLVVENLLENSLRYAGDGATCTVALARSGDGALLEVADDGTGVPDEDVPRLFERFFRSDRARTTRGTGLGLAIVKHVIESAGGNVEARGGQGRGLDVRCVLP
jgi:two-component system phosphate regulon sensor histidine kinase PhoR